MTSTQLKAICAVCDVVVRDGETINGKVSHTYCERCAELLKKCPPGKRLIYCEWECKHPRYISDERIEQTKTCDDCMADIQRQIRERGEKLNVNLHGRPI